MKNEFWRWFCTSKVSNFFPLNKTSTYNKCYWYEKRVKGRQTPICQLDPFRILKCKLRQEFYKSLLWNFLTGFALISTASATYRTSLSIECFELNLFSFETLHKSPFAQTWWEKKVSTLSPEKVNIWKFLRKTSLKASCDCQCNFISVFQT